MELHTCETSLNGLANSCVPCITISWMIISISIDPKSKMKDTIFVENFFILFHFNKKYFQVKMNIYGNTAKIQIFSMVFQLYMATQTSGGGEFRYVC